MPAERAADRVLRLIGMVAYLDAHGEASLDDLAQRFGVRRAQVLADIDTLWLSGTPGYQCDDLIDFDAFCLDRGTVRLTQARGMTRPLRLGAREAVVLVAAVRALAEGLGPVLDDERRAVLTSTLTKLTNLARLIDTRSTDTVPAEPGLADQTPDVVAIDLGVNTRPDITTTVSAALARGRRLRLRYVNAADRTSERDVDPIRLVADAGTGYLLGWCLAADAERLFRLDRMLDAHVLNEPVEAHDVSDDADQFVPGTAAVVTVRLTSRARRVAETAQVSAVRNLDDGSFEVDLPVVSSAWLEHLLLGVADDVIAVHPPQVAQQVAATARTALRAYHEVSDGPTEGG
ncbi:MAG: WYL domain-containing protein [Micrococcales bacterium]|nr:WYL domain-containing protein [Micrococcales bacterium]MCL2666795.1 WYL domain-containing protein [Micrococcales bacterium]